MPSSSVQILVDIVEPLLIFGVFIAAPVTYMAWTGKFLYGVFITWALMIVVYGILSIGPIIVGFDRDYPDWTQQRFPETTAMAPALFLGWWPGLIFGFVAWMVRAIYAKCVNPGQVTSPPAEQSEIDPDP